MDAKFCLHLKLPFAHLSPTGLFPRLLLQPSQKLLRTVCPILMSDPLFIYLRSGEQNTVFINMAEELSASSGCWHLGLIWEEALMGPAVLSGCSCSREAPSASLPLSVNRKQTVTSPVLQVRQLTLCRKVL